MFDVNALKANFNDFNRMKKINREFQENFHAKQCIQWYLL